MFNPKQYRHGIFSTRATMDDALNYAYSVNRPRVLAAFPELFTRYAKETA
jgi:hypothetical protein